MDAVLSVQPIGAYKPSPQVYAMAPAALGMTAAELMFVSGNAWDAAGAASAGLRAILIEPAGTPAERLPAAPTARVRHLLGVLPIVGLGLMRGYGFPRSAGARTRPTAPASASSVRT